MKALGLLSGLLLMASTALAQNPPPIPPSTNTVWAWETNICNGIYEQTWSYLPDTYVATNGVPWSGFGGIDYQITETQCNNEADILHIEWTWGGRSAVFYTNVNLATATLNLFGQYVWSPYYIPGTNEVVQYVAYKTDGNTLSFAHNLTGPWTWSGSSYYREPVQDLSYRFVQGVSTDGSVTNVHLWATNQFYMNGALYRQELVH